MNVAAMLTTKGRDIITAKPTDTMRDVCLVMETHGIGAVVIVDDAGQLTGIVSERDFVRAMARQGAAILDKPVSAYMTSDVVTCALDDKVAEIMGRMTDGKFRHMPVIDGGQMIGMISIGDVVKQRIAEAEAESRAMREYIATG